MIAEFEKNVFPSPEEGELWLESFLKMVTLFTLLFYNRIYISAQVTIVRKKKQGKADLEGNQARAFLKCLDRLEENLMRECRSLKLRIHSSAQSF